jgi:Tol biopolymer transport system component
MSLSPGSKVGHYEIVAALGRGGMGEVYRARDTQLDRNVALKVLPESFAGDPDRLMRFTREAKTLASLNHPNIAAIYGIESQALVMELVDGDDLSDLIALPAALPLSEAVAIAKQVADALEAAHEAGIIHRDLKPANIKVRPDGTVKVLDFGLAKAMDPSGMEDPGPTMTSPAQTAMGIILGTAAYMSPEQARGKPVDKRADIWSFGVVLYEMLTGATLFAGETVSDVLAAVLRADIDLAKLPAAVPPGLRQLLSRCLEKDPRRRLRDIGEARVLLETPSMFEPAAALLPPRSGSHVLPWAVAAAVVIGVASWAAIARPWQTAVTTTPIHASVQAGFVGGFPQNLSPALAVSPDGNTLAFSVARQGQKAGGIYLRRLDQLTATMLAGTEDGVAPFFSRDGQTIGFFAGGKLLIIPAGGGAPAQLADAPMSRGATWGEDDVITFSPSAAPGGLLMRIPARGGTLTPLGAMPEKQGTQRWPQALPGNRAILYTTAPSVDNFDQGCLAVQTLDGAPPRVLQCGGSNWTYVESGHLLYARGRILFAVPFDLSRLTITGSEVPIVENIRASTVSGVAQFAVARDGVLAYLTGLSDAGYNESETSIDIVDRRGSATRLGGQPLNWLSLSFSPDGARLAMDVISSKGASIHVFDISRDVSQRATFSDVGERRPIWGPTANRVTFAAAIGGPPNLYWQDADGGKPERLTTSDNVQFPGSWSPDGRTLAYTEVRNGAGDVMLLPIEGDEKTGLRPGTPRPLFATAARESHPAFSPDGKWLAFSSNDSSVLQVYVTEVANPTRRWQVSTDGGLQPMWSRTRPELIFITEDAITPVYFVTYQVEKGVFRPSRPREWIETRFNLRSGVNDVALHPDGNRIAGSIGIPGFDKGPAEPNVGVITNLFDLLRSKVRATK